MLLSYPQQPQLWGEPVADFEQRVLVDYLAPDTKYGPGHRGIDIQLAPYEDLAAPMNSFLAFSGTVVDRPVVTLSDGKYKASFEPACALVPLGATVLRGEVFATHCEPLETYRGHCDSCVHFSARDESGYLSPKYLMGLLGPSVLLG